jgi:hypothetical protein
MKKNELKKWPNDWHDHIFQTSRLYYEDKEIWYMSGCVIKTEIDTIRQKENIKEIHLIMEKKGKIYDVFISKSSESPSDLHFVLDSYYREYFTVEESKIKNTNEFDVHSIGTDLFGLFFYYSIGGQGGIVYSAYEIIKSIEDIINSHTGGDDDDNDGDSDNPIEPNSPSDVVEPELSFS